MNIVYQLDDDANLSVKFRQANNDKRIDFVRKLISSTLQADRESLVKAVEGLRTKGIEKVPEVMEKDKLYNLMNENMTIGYNLGVSDSINLIKNK